MSDAAVLIHRHGNHVLLGVTHCLFNSQLSVAGLADTDADAAFLVSMQ